MGGTRRGERGTRRGEREGEREEGGRNKERRERRGAWLGTVQSHSLVINTDLNYGGSEKSCGTLPPLQHNIHIITQSLHVLMNYTVIRIKCPLQRLAHWSGQLVHS